MVYAILDIKELDNIIYKDYNNNKSYVFQDSAKTVRKNNDNTLFIISFLEKNISYLLEDSNKIYTSEEIHTYLNNPDNGWVSEE